MVHYLISAPPPLCSFVLDGPSGMQHTAKCNNLTIPNQMMVARRMPSEKCILFITAHLALCFVKKRWPQYKNTFSVGPACGLPYRSSWDLGVRGLSTLVRKPDKPFGTLPSISH